MCTQIKEKLAKKAIVAGSFDPVTKGHEYLIAQASAKYEEVWAVIFNNPEKRCVFPLQLRLEMLRAVCAKYPNVTADCNGGMQYLYAAKKGITVAVRGYRNRKDLEYEQKIADFNRQALPGYETELLPCPQELSGISSTLVRERMAESADLSALISPEVLPYLEGFALKVLFDK